MADDIDLDSDEEQALEAAWEKLAAEWAKQGRRQPTPTTTPAAGPTANPPPAVSSADPPPKPQRIRKHQSKS